MTSVPKAFYCEHALSKSRVLALLARRGCYDAVQTVLSTSDPDLAQASAALLELALSGRGPGVEDETERLSTLLPRPVSSSLRQAVEWTLAGRWPVAAHTHRPRIVDPDDDQPRPAVLESLLRTPSEARLADLSGPTVRLVSLLELHVHDPDRLLAWAEAADWEPADPDELDEGDKRDVLGAVMWLAENTRIPPGTDLVCAESSAETLRVDRGDEVSDWSPRPIAVNFSTGWRLRADENQPFDAKLLAALPKFAALFPIIDEDEGWQLTPRTAAALYSQLSILADFAYDDIKAHGSKPVEASSDEPWYLFDELPQISWRQDAAWRRDVARAADDLCSDIERGDWPEPRCNAEELMLHLAIEHAEEMADHELSLASDLNLPEHGDDYDWGGCSDVLFQDDDITMLYDAFFDGIEDPEGDLNRRFGIGDLRPGNWLTTFNNMESRDPDRGYRR
jgi:hypothetical protein